MTPLSGSEMSALVITQSATLFLTILPDVNMIRNADPSDASVRADVRTSECVAVGLTLATGLGVSLLSKSATPLVVAAVAATTLVVLSEFLLSQQDSPRTTTTLEGN